MPTKLFDYIRYALYVLLVIIVLFLFKAWDQEHPKEIATGASTQLSTPTDHYIPTLPQHQNGAGAVSSTPQSMPQKTESQWVHVNTDVLSVDINTRGGDISQIKLLNYPQDLHSEEPVVLLNDNPETRYIAQSGLLSSIGPETSSGQALYTADQTTYTLEKNQDQLQVKLYWKKDNITVTKIYTFKPNDYEVGVDYEIQNQSSKPWEGNLYLQLLRMNTPVQSKNGLVSLATYFGAAISSPDKPFQKISFKEMDKNNLNQTIVGGWAAMIQHYFVSAWVPDQKTQYQYYTRVTPDHLYTVGMMGPSITVAPNQTITTQSKFYAGPSIADRLITVAPTLKLTIDYGWFWFISGIIFWMMQKIYNVIGNWGWSIVLVTFIIKLCFYHLSEKSYRSMSGLKKLQPKIEAIKERFGDDKQKMTQATLELYKKEKINPMSGCLPILIQIPVFIALYWVLVESVQLRQAPFILWIHDLSTKDPYYVLPLLMGLSMFLQQRLNPPPPDPMQAKVLMFMPVIFTVLFLNFPAGLMLYWFVNNLLSFAQQWHIMHRMEKSEKKK